MADLTLVRISALSQELLNGVGDEFLAIDDVNSVDGEGHPITKKIQISNVVKIGLPAYSGNGSKVLSLNSGATALEWVAPTPIRFVEVSATALASDTTVARTHAKTAAKMAIWFIHAVSVDDPLNVMVKRISASHDGTDVSYEENGPTPQGDSASHLSFNVDVAGSNLELQVVNSDTNNYTLTILEQIV